MTKPVTIPNTFATATTAIPLSQLDSDFSTVATALNDANTYSNYAADTGVANAYVVTLTGVSTTYSAGLRIQFKAGNANTGASTLNVNGGGTKNITFQDASALSSGTIAANAIVDVMYDGTQFLLMNDPAGTVGTGDVVGPAGATANAIVRFNSTTGKLVKNSVVTIADSTGDMSGVGALTATGNVSFDGGTFVFNESGADKDFRIEGDTEPNLFFTDASTDRVGIGTSSPAAKLTVLDTTANAATALVRLLGQSSYNLDIQSVTNGAGTVGNRYNFAIGSGGGEFSFSNSGGTRLTLDSSGNLGLGVTPSAWNAGYKAFEINSVGNGISAQAGAGAQLNVSNNAYWVSGWKYGVTDLATLYAQQGGKHIWSTAPSGTAGNAITFTQAMTLDASGNLGVGTTTLNVGVYGKAITLAATASAYGGLELSGTTGGAIDFQTSQSTRQVQLLGNSNGFLMLTNGGSGLTERARITSGGDLLVGGSSAVLSAANRGNITITGSASSIVSVGTSASAYTYLYHDASGAEVWNNQNTYLRFGTNNTERARITSGGNLDLQKNLGLGGTSATTSGTGITFPATQSASTDANTLDDYEEGTFNITFAPLTSGTITVNTSLKSLSYRKIGSVVTVTGNIGVTSVSSPVGRLRINGLPFSNVSGSSYDVGFFLVSQNLSSAATLMGQIPNVQSFIDVYRTDGTTWNDTAANICQAGTNFWISFSYFTS